MSVRTRETWLYPVQGGHSSLSGMVWAAAAGVLFGLFQAFNRRANQHIDAFRGTYRLLLVAAVCLALALPTRDLSLLRDAGPSSWVAFALAGTVHFFGGWTLLGLSQQQIGAARTGAALSATPLIGALLAAIVLGERIGTAGFVGVGIVTLGVALLATSRGFEGERRRQVPWLALGAALCWGTSPLFIRWGLVGLPEPIIGVTIGVTAAAVVYAVVLALGALPISQTDARPANRWIVVAGILVAAALTAQWISFDLIDIGIAITLMQLAAPVVLIAAPFVVGGRMERITGQVVAGMIAVVGGSILVTLT